MHHCTAQDIFESDIFEPLKKVKFKHLHIFFPIDQVYTTPSNPNEITFR